MQVSSIFVYPIKGCRGIAMRSSTVTHAGLLHDRKFMVIDSETGKFLSQKRHPRLALVRPELNGRWMRILNDGDGERILGELSLSDAVRGERRTAFMRGEEFTAFDQGDRFAKPISEFLDMNCRLVRIEEGPRRSFTDSEPLLVVTEATHSEMRPPGNINRFRPNIVVGGATADAELSWSSVRMGRVVLRGEEACERCTIVNVDQMTGERDARFDSVLEKVKAYRRARGEDTIFGRRFSVAEEGTVWRGAEVIPL